MLEYLMERLANVPAVNDLAEGDITWREWMGDLALFGMISLGILSAVLGLTAFQHLVLH